MAGERLLLDVAGGLILSEDNPSDIHSEIKLVLLINLKYLYTG